MGGLIHLPQLAIQQQQPTDPLEKYGQLLSIQKLAASQQLQQSQIQNAQLDTQAKQLEVAQAQRDAQDAQTMRTQAPNFIQKDDSGKISGFDANGYYNSLLSNGVPINKVSAIRMGQAQMSKALADSGESNIKLADAKVDSAYNVLEGVRAAAKLPGAGPNTVQGAYQDALPKLQQLGFDTSQYPQSFAQVGDAGLQRFEAELGAHKQIINDAKNQAEIGKNTSAQAASDVETKLKQKQLDMANSGGAVPGVPLETQEANTWLAQHPTKTLADYQKYAKTLVPAFNFNLQAQGVGGGGTPSSTDANGNPVPYDQQIKSMGPKGGVVKAIIEGRQDPPASFAQKSPYWQDVMQKVYSVDPDFNQQRAQLRKAYAVGPPSKEINAINTAMGHVGVLGDAIDALNNSDVKALNKVANALGVQVGKDNVTTFNTIVHRVGPELSKAYIGAGGSAGERGSDEKDFDPSLGPQQLKSNVGITAQLLRSKIGALENQWNQNKAPSMPSFQDHFITPEAKKQLDKWNPQQGSQTAAPQQFSHVSASGKFGWDGKQWVPIPGK